MTSSFVRGSKVSERDGYVTVVVDVKGNTYEVTQAQYDELLGLKLRKQDRRLDREARLTARIRFDEIIKRWHVRQQESEKPRRNRKKIVEDRPREASPQPLSTGPSQATPVSNTTMKDTKPRTQRGVIVASRPGFHTILVDSTGNTLEVPEDDYNRWLALHEAKTDVGATRDARLANRARAKHMMDNWGKKGKQKKVYQPPPVRLSTMKEPETEEECYRAAMDLLGFAYIS